MVVRLIVNGTETREMTGMHGINQKTSRPVVYISGPACNLPPPRGYSEQHSARRSVHLPFRGCWDRCSEPFQKNIFDLEMDNPSPIRDDMGANKTCSKHVEITIGHVG